MAMCGSAMSTDIFVWSINFLLINWLYNIIAISTTTSKVARFFEQKRSPIKACLILILIYARTLGQSSPVE